MFVECAPPPAPELPELPDVACDEVTVVGLALPVSPDCTLPPVTLAPPAP